MRRSLASIVVLLCCLAGCGGGADAPGGARDRQGAGAEAGGDGVGPGEDAVAAGRAADRAVLVFSRTMGYRHASIPAGIEAIEEIGRLQGFTVESTEDPSWFADETLSRFGAVVWLSTTGDVLDGAQEAAFERYIRGGGGYVGIHAAADTEYDWAWYGGLVGAYFASHPEVQEAVVLVEDRGHPSTLGLPERWVRRDEWYDYRRNPREGGEGSRIRILASLIEGSYRGGRMGSDHPIAWCHEYDGGRAWYTGGGHTIESFGEPEFREHIAGGIVWAAGW